jgi:hypothetical protein
LLESRQVNVLAQLEEINASEQRQVQGRTQGNLHSFTLKTNAEAAFGCFSVNLTVLTWESDKKAHEYLSSMMVIALNPN